MGQSNRLSAIGDGLRDCLPTQSLMLLLGCQGAQSAGVLFIDKFVVNIKLRLSGNFGSLFIVHKLACSSVCGLRVANDNFKTYRWSWSRS